MKLQKQLQLKRNFCKLNIQQFAVKQQLVQLNQLLQLQQLDQQINAATTPNALPTTAWNDTPQLVL